MTILRLQATKRLRKDINIFSATSARKINGDFRATAAFGSYGVKCEQKANMLITNGLLRQAFTRKNTPWRPKGHGRMSNGSSLVLHDTYGCS